MKVRSDEQLLLALNAPERPERGAEGGKRWQQLQTTWVAKAAVPADTSSPQATPAAQ